MSQLRRRLFCRVGIDRGSIRRLRSFRSAFIGTPKPLRKVPSMLLLGESKVDP